jgi:prophage DNA circulation protein
MAFGLLLASYKGVPFHTKSAHESVGRRLVKHEFPNSEEWFVEDLGIQIPSFNATAYFSTDCDPEVAYAGAVALIEVCQTIGPGPLILPPSDFIIAHCQSCKRNFDKDIQGYIAFELEFLEEGESGGQAPFQIGLAVRMAGAALGAAIGTISDLGASLLEAITPAPDYLLAVGDIVRDALGVVDAATDVAVVQPIEAAGLSIALTNAVASVSAFEVSATPVIVRPPNRIVVQPWVMALPGAPPALGTVATAFSSLIQVVGSYVQKAADTTSQPAVFAEQLQNAIVNGVGQDPTPGYGQAVYPDRVMSTAYSIGRAKTIAVVGPSVRILIGIAMCQAYAEAIYATRQEAQKARGLMVATVDQLIYGIDPGEPGEHPGMPQLVDARDLASTVMLKQIADLQPMVQMSLTEAMPALYLAWRIYQDPFRAQELADRNDAPHPMWMPASFEARAR